MKDLTDLSPVELVDRLTDQAIQNGYAKGIGNGGMIASTRDALAITKIEVFRRMGITQSPEVTNRTAFIYLAVIRKDAACGACHKEPRGGRGINFWTWDILDPVPLLLIMAHNGATVEKLKAVKHEVLPLCRICAKKRRGKLLENGNVDLKEYL